MTSPVSGSHSSNIQHLDGSTVLDAITKGQPKLKKANIALIVTAVALSVLGLILVCTGSLAGILPILVSLPLFYAAYNGHQINKNLDKIIKNPSTIMESEENASIDLKKLKTALKQNTFKCSSVIDKVVKLGTTIDTAVDSAMDKALDKGINHFQKNSASASA